MCDPAAHRSVRVRVHVWVCVYLRSSEQCADVVLSTKRALCLYI